MGKKKMQDCQPCLQYTSMFECHSMPLRAEEQEGHTVMSWIVDLLNPTYTLMQDVVLECHSLCFETQCG